MRRRIAAPLSLACAATALALPAASHAAGSHTPSDDPSIDQYAPSLPEPDGNHVPPPPGGSGGGPGAPPRVAVLSPRARAALRSSPQRAYLTRLAESPALGATPRRGGGGASASGSPGGSHGSSTGAASGPRVVEPRDVSFAGAIKRTVGGSGAPIVMLVAALAAATALTALFASRRPREQG